MELIIISILLVVLVILFVIAFFLYWIAENLRKTTNFVWIIKELLKKQSKVENESDEDFIKRVISGLN